VSGSQSLALLAKAESNDLRVDHHLSALRYCEIGGDADQCLPILLCVYRLRNAAASKAGGLLRVLLVWIGALSTDAERAREYLWLQQTMTEAPHSLLPAAICQKPAAPATKA
jgi:hypothetical protein